MLVKSLVLSDVFHLHYLLLIQNLGIQIRDVLLRTRVQYWHSCLCLHFIWICFSIIILQILTTKNKVTHAALVSWSSIVDLLVIVSLDVWWGPFVLSCGSPFLHWRIGTNILAFLSMSSNLAVDLKSCNLDVIILHQLFHLLVARWPRLCLRLPLHVFDAHSIPLSIQHDALWIEKAELIAGFVEDFLALVHWAFHIWLNELLGFLHGFILELIIFCFIHMILVYLLLLILLTYLHLVIPWRGISSLHSHILAKALLWAQNSLMTGLGWHHVLLQIASNIDTLIINNSLCMHLLLLHYLFILHFNFLNIIWVDQWPIQEAFIVLLLQLLLRCIWVLNRLIAQGVLSVALALNGIGWSYGLVASCLRNVWSLAVNCFLHLVWMSLLIVELATHMLIVIEVCWVAVSHLVLVLICLLIQFLWVTSLMLGVHVLRAIRVLTCLRIVLVCPWLALQMTIVKILMGVGAAKVACGMLWCLLPFKRQSVGSSVLEAINTNNSCSWRRQYDPTWSCTQRLLMMVCWIYLLTLFAHWTILLGEVLGMRFYYLTSGFWITRNLNGLHVLLQYLGVAGQILLTLSVLVVASMLLILLTQGLGVALVRLALRHLLGIA